MAHKIAIRYCGGCNSRYDRGAFARQIQERFPNLQLKIFNPWEEFLAALVICGCPARCAGQRDLPERLPRFVVAAAEDCERAAVFLNETTKLEKC